MQIVSNWDNLQEMSNPIFWKKNKEKIRRLLNLSIQLKLEMNVVLTQNDIINN